MSVRRAGWVLGAAVLLAAGGCGSSSPEASSAHHHNASSTTSTTSSLSTTTTTSARTGSGSGSSSASSGSTGSHAATTTSAPPSSGLPSAPSPATAGTYTYSQSGQSTSSDPVLVPNETDPSQGTIVVDPATSQGAGRWTQEWHSYIDPGQTQDYTDSTFSISPNGIALLSEVISEDGQTFTCPFSTPLQIANWPPTVGHQFSGTASCTGSASFTLQASGKIAATQAVSVSGQSVSCDVIDTTATTSGSLSSTTTETDCLDPTAAIDVQENSNESATYDGVTIDSTLMRQLLSTKPS